MSDLLDKWGAFRSRLFREACVFHKGNYVKDLSRLGRDLNKVIILDNSPASYIFHPENAVGHLDFFVQHTQTLLFTEKSYISIWVFGAGGGSGLSKRISNPTICYFCPHLQVPVASWFNDMSDTELLDLIPFFERLSKVDDIYDILRHQSTSQS